jgi:DNA-binding GntR family transcriptional regulator
MSDVTDASSGSQTELVLQQLTDLIMRCELPPGEWVSEKQLAELTGFGLAPVRSAMARLRHDGLLIAVPRVGYQVAPMTLEDVVDLYDVWSVVGAAIVERAARRATAEQMAAYEALQRSLRKQQRARKISAVEVAARTFELVVEMAQSRRLAGLFEKFSVDLGRCLAVATSASQEMNAVVMEADQMLLAIQEHDPETALEGFKTFVEANRRIVVDVLLASPGIADAPLRLPARPA